MFSGLENPLHLLILALIVLILFGPKRLPELGRSLGTGIRHFRDSLANRHEDGANQETPPVAAAKPAPEQHDETGPPKSAG